MSRDKGRARRSESRKRREALQVFNLCKAENINALYNIGIGPPPHKEGWVLKDLFPQLQLFAAEPQLSIVRERGPSYPGRVFPVAIGGLGPGTCELNMCSHPGGCSLLEPAKGEGGSLTRTLYEGTETVPLLPLDDFDKLAGEQERILLWMDIEGAELLALKSGECLLGSGRVKLVNLEVTAAGCPPRWEGSYTFEEIDGWLRERGYVAAKRYYRTGANVELTTFFENVVWRLQ